MPLLGGAGPACWGSGQELPGRAQGGMCHRAMWCPPCILAGWGARPSSQGSFGVRRVVADRRLRERLIWGAAQPTSPAAESGCSLSALSRPPARDIVFQPRLAGTGPRRSHQPPRPVCAHGLLALHQPCTRMLGSPTAGMLLPLSISPHRSLIWRSPHPIFHQLRQA